MAGENIQDWSVTAINNGTADTAINWAEGQPRASVNNSARSMMAAHAKQRNLWNGSIVTGGSPNSQTFIEPVGYTGIPTGLWVRLKIGPGLTNTGAVALTMNGTLSAAVKDQGGNDLTAGVLLAGSYAEFLFDGSYWIMLRGIVGFNQVVVRVFAATGVQTYTPTANMKFCIIECIGGGGGGGGVVGDPNHFRQGGGGGSGGYSRRRATAAQIGSSQVVTVGAGGFSGAGGNGTVGGSTSVGSLCGAGGGGGGINNGVAGDGGTAGSGDIALPGAPGCSGFININATTVGVYMYGAANGASSVLGGGGRCPAANAGQTFDGGWASANTGAGGAGAATNAVVSNGTGGQGGSGLVIITEFV